MTETTPFASTTLKAMTEQAAAAKAAKAAKKVDKTKPAAVKAAPKAAPPVEKVKRKVEAAVKATQIGVKMAKASVKLIKAAAAQVPKVTPQPKAATKSKTGPAAPAAAPKLELLGKQRHERFLDYPQIPGWLSLQQVSELWSVSRSYVLLLIAEKRLQAHRLGTTLAIKVGTPFPEALPRADRIEAERSVRNARMAALAKTGG